jgi:hypothetical protein
MGQLHGGINMDGFKWIPVKERLPEKEGRYLVTVTNIHDGKKIVWISDYSNKISNRDMQDDDLIFPNGFAFGDMWWDGVDNLEKVEAWFPIPDPYEMEGKV